MSIIKNSITVHSDNVHYELHKYFALLTKILYTDDDLSIFLDN